MDLENEAERYLIIKMAELAKQWKEPHDDEDREQMRKNAPLEDKYEVYKEMLRDLFMD